MQQLLSSWLYSLKIGSLILVIAAVVFAALEQNFSFRKLNKPWRDTVLDLEFFFLGLFYPPTVSFGISAFLAWFAIGRNGPAPTTSPAVFGMELFGVLFIDDIWVYIRHRAFHSRSLWAFHSIHHNSEHVNWTSGQRQHPVEVIADIIGETLIFYALAIAGANLNALFWAGLIIGVWNFFVHSNTRWTFGPLRYVVVSPVWHRWHHSDSPEAVDKNFAVMFSCIDVVMRTSYMPKDKIPQTTGLCKSEKNTLPKTFIGQIAHPFRR